MTPWPAAGFLLIAAVLSVLGLAQRRRWAKVSLHLASAGAGAGALWLLIR